MEHELWLTRLFNDYLAGLGSAILGPLGIAAENPQRPWENWFTMELFVVLLVVLTAAVLKAGLSVDKPGKLQHLFEVLYEFLSDSAHGLGMHHSEKFVPYFGTIFTFILSMNLIGIIPVFESPTNFPWVPCGLAICTFVYYNYMGFRANGPGYLAHFAGPVWWLMPLMIPVELISHFARPLSLTVRMFGNMFAGEQVTDVILHLSYIVFPAIFMGLHVFVAFLQAYIFTLLTMIYVASATSHEH